MFVCLFLVFLIFPTFIDQTCTLHQVFLLTVCTTGVKIFVHLFWKWRILISLDCISFCFLRNWLLVPLNSAVCVWYSSCRICRCWRWWFHRKFFKGWKLTSSKFFSNKHQALILCSWFAIVIPHLGCPTRAHSDTDLWRAPSRWLSQISEIHKLSVPSICKSFTCFSCSISLYIIHSPATPHCTPLQVFLFVLFKYFEQLVSIWGP